MLNYQDLPRLSPEQCHARFESAKSALGEGVLVRLIAFVFFALGASRKGIAERLDLPKPTLTSFVQRVVRDGLPALEDRRFRSSTFLQQAPRERKLPPRLVVKTEKLVVVFDNEAQIELPRSSPVQCRTVLLTLLESGLLPAKDVASALGLSTERVRQLRFKLIENDVEALIDRRRGRHRDLVMTPRVKAEMIQQYVLNLHTGASTSSRQLTEDLAERCDIRLAERTVRLHVSRLGLRQIRTSLPALLEAEKKTSEPIDPGESPARTDRQ